MDLLYQTRAPMWQKQCQPRPLLAPACYRIDSGNQLAVSCDIGLCGSSIDVVNRSAVSCDIGLCGSSIDVVNQLAGG